MDEHSELSRFDRLVDDFNMAVHEEERNQALAPQYVPEFSDEVMQETFSVLPEEGQMKAKAAWQTYQESKQEVQSCYEAFYEVNLNTVTDHVESLLEPESRPPQEEIESMAHDYTRLNIERELAHRQSAFEANMTQLYKENGLNYPHSRESFGREGR